MIAFALALQTVARSAAESRLELFGDISLSDPLFLAAAPIALFAAWWGRASRRVAALAVPVVPPSVVSLAPSLAQRLAWTPMCLRIVAVLLVAVALARPLQGRVQVSSSTEGIDIALVVDRSTSMEQRDVPGGQRRIDLVRDVVGDYARRRTTDREGAADELALFAFARFADLLVPFTRDADALGQVIDTLDVVPRQELDGTGIGLAVATAASVLRDSEAKSKVVVLLTDGEETTNDVPPAKATELAIECGVRVHVVYAGPRVVSSRFGGMQRVIDLTDVKEMAEKTGGRFFHAQDRSGLEAAYAAIEELERTPREESRFAERFDLYPRVLLIALGAYVLAWLLGATWLRRVA
ncbi:MAG: VWA domain-containing protein [Planctomycetota bacterium]